MFPNHHINVGNNVRIYIVAEKIKSTIADYIIPIIIDNSNNTFNNKIRAIRGF